jgi:hypothetical protein
MPTGAVTSQAIAYLKADLSGKPSSVPPDRRVDVSDADAPILRHLADGLVVAYVVDRETTSSGYRSGTSRRRAAARRNSTPSQSRIWRGGHRALSGSPRTRAVKCSPS